MKQSDLKPIIVFYILAFIISWAGWVPVILNSQKNFSRQSIYVYAFLILPAASPVLAAVITRRAYHLEESRKNLINSLFQYRVKPIWYLTASLVPLVILLLTKSFEAIIILPNALTLSPGTPREVFSILVVSLAANPSEEMGWRGFALPRLQNIFSPFSSSIIIGCLTGAWHLPFFYWNESPMSAYPFLPWFVGTICISIIATWLFNNSNQDLAIVSLFHILLNTFSVMIGIGSFYIYVVVSMVLVIVLLAFFRRQFFSLKNLNKKIES